LQDLPPLRILPNSLTSVEFATGGRAGTGTAPLPRSGACNKVSEVSSPIRVTGLDHIVLRCRDVERSLSFYIDQLGMEPERVDEWRRGDVPFPSVRLTPTTIIDLFGPDFAGDPDGTNIDHFCLVIDTDDLDAVADAFPDSKKADMLFGAQGYASSVYITDPDGIELERYADTPGWKDQGMEVATIRAWDPR
jgi:catechol 2,3-dioxygenase-like lactoylglutathione lyase family enzyme